MKHKVVLWFVKTARYRTHRDWAIEELLWRECLDDNGDREDVPPSPVHMTVRVLTGWARDMPRDLLRPQPIGAPCRPLPCITLEKIALGKTALGG